MFHSQQTNETLRNSDERRSFQRVAVSLQGRLMLENHQEYDCRILDMSPGDARISTNAMPVKGERVIAYIEHLGRLEGTVTELRDMEFVIALNATERKREKLAAQLTWIANKHELGLPEDRRHERLAPRQSRSELTLDDGRNYPCRIIDLSLSGAAVDIDVRPAIGTLVSLGHMRGRVVRHFQEGVAIEFLALQSKETLSSML
ncbi:PilZ domain-containing protein [Rhizobium sp. L1K21]|uniref:PilZ domain-containing protein n=1 Tax=Rhizobium sp. L1K21 TaxID=2954933 RepID=UPI002093908C|nr:PilZ domain-containing protein [Rhizobium sp. L1K21]MCO6186116.1 PilZ domain-containing protein [Rhizobium sp. L1K21]